MHLPAFIIFVFAFGIFLPVGSLHSANGPQKVSQIQIDLLDTGQESNSCPSNEHNCSSAESDLYFIRLHGGSDDLLSLFPFINEPNLTVKLYRDPALNRRLADQLNYNVFVTDQNGKRIRVDEPSSAQSSASSLGYFRGQILNSEYVNSSFSSSSAIFAIGNIDRKSRTVSLQAFIHLPNNVILYLRPRSGLQSDTSSIIHSNLYLISSESDNFYQMFQRQFAQNLKSRKRNTEIDNSCPLIIYVDYSLFVKLNKDRAKTILFVNFAFNFANEIFLRTKFTKDGYLPSKGGDHYDDYGHILCQVVIEERPPRLSDDFYNHNRIYWPGQFLRNLLSNLKGHESHCLAYLFTDLKINDSSYTDLNGFARVGSIFSNDKEVPNSGVISFGACDDPWNWYCVINFAHELGHNWGAPHDPDGEDCISPTNGSYIMRMPFLDSYGSNNLHFSPCSIRAIYQHIQYVNRRVANPAELWKSYCTKCGNGRVEYPEECDEGQHSGHCCTNDCKLLTRERNAKCSHFNHECCDEKCQVKLRSDVCRHADALFCWQEVRCDGRGLACPNAIKMPDGARCSHGGICQGGYCNSSCPADTHVECKCPSLLDQCFSCCFESLFMRDEYGDLVSRGVPGKCLPFVPLRDGTPCQYKEDKIGTCISGECLAYEIVPVYEDTEAGHRTIWTGIICLLVGTFIVFMTMLYFVRRHAKHHQLVVNESNYTNSVHVFELTEVAKLNGNGNGVNGSPHANAHSNGGQSNESQTSSI